MAGTAGVPVVHGRGRWKQLAFGAAAFHALGATLAGALLGAVLGELGRTTLKVGPAGSGVALLIAACAYLALAAHELGVASLPIPSTRRQVPARWRLTLPPRVAGLLYGAGLGVGVATFMNVTTVYGVVIGVFLSGDPVIGALVFGLYGFARGAPILAFAWRFERLEQSWAVIDRIRLHEGTVRTGNGIGLAASGGFVVLVAAFGS